MLTNDLESLGARHYNLDTQEWDEESVRVMTIYSGGGSYFLLRSWLMGEFKKIPKAIAAILYSLLINTDWKELILQVSSARVKTI